MTSIPNRSRPGLLTSAMSGKEKGVCALVLMLCVCVVCSLSVCMWCVCCVQFICVCMRCV